jgi:hypothetical protein
VRYVFVAIAATLLSSPLVAQSLTGVWKPVEIVIASGPTAGRHTTDVQPGLLMFTNGHYSWLRVTSFDPRPALSASPTDEERGRVFSAFTGQGGTYDVNGSTLTLLPTVAKNPAVMMRGTPDSYTLERDGDAYWLIGKTPEGAEWRMKLVRVENQTSTKASPGAGTFDPQKLLGAWEMVKVVDASTGKELSSASNRRHWLIYTDKHELDFYNGTDRAVIAPADFAKLTPPQKKEVRYARYFNEANQLPVLGGNGARYTMEGARITYQKTLQSDPYNVGRSNSETILRLDDEMLVVRVDPDAAGVVREETWRRID